MKKILICAVVFILVVFILLACSNNSVNDNPLSEKRSFAMSISDFPYANTVNAFDASFALMLQNTDMVMMHFDGGVPWQEALDGTTYPQGFLNELNFKKSKTPTSHTTYLAVTPIAFERNALASNISDEGSQPLSPPWDTYAFDNQNVIDAYINHCKFMINFFEPEFFAYAIEANLVMNTSPSKWSALVNLMQRVYASLKAEYPSLPIFFSIQASWVYLFQDIQLQKLPEVLPSTDFIAVSAYPFTEEPDPNLLPENYFSFIANLAPEKPFAITETSWPAEDVTLPYPIFLQESEERQETYMKFLLSNMKNLNAKFVSWFFIADYDQFWESDMKDSPIAPILRLWKDSGLYDGNLQPRKAQKQWQEELLKEKE